MHFFYRNPVEWIEFPMQQPAFMEHMSYAPAMQFHDAEDHISSEVKSGNWWLNEQVSWLNFVIATMIWTATLATAASRSYNYPFILPFRPETYFTLLGLQEEMASIFDSRKHRLND
jgi:hypothetical protein